MSSAAHKPRRRLKGSSPSPGPRSSASAPSTRSKTSVGASSSTSSRRTRAPSDSATYGKAPTFPLAAFFWPARSGMTAWEVLPLTLMAAGLFRWAVGLWGYSGFQRPPLFGDYEAQRHWMEITLHLPISQWYFHDLQWWGLDYPPLTAYHSWLCGWIGSAIDPAWFALFSSRGLHDANLKVFMRATVLVSEYLIYVPALTVFVRRYSRLSNVTFWSSQVALAAIMLQPATMLVDHAHFQYNTVMLGFVIASMSSMLANRYLWSAVFFVAALGFKQMALYYALPVFSFLLGSCLFPAINPGRLVSIGAVTAMAFALLVLPIVLGALHDVAAGIDARPDFDGPPAPLPILTFLDDVLDREAAYYPVVQQLVQIVHRVFPFARGLFEDKVANFWCAANVVFKLKHLPPALLQKASLAATLASILPANIVLFLYPRKNLLPLAFAATAWGFFLFSYQVHEKSVLLPLMPMTLLLAGKHGLRADTRAWVGFANILGAWTIFPLLKRVDLALPYAVLTLLWAYLMGVPLPALVEAIPDGQSWSVRVGSNVLHGLFYGVMVAWHVAEAFVAPPKDKPDLWTVANVGVGAAGFGICYLWCLVRLASEVGLFGGKTAKTKTK